MNKKVSPEEFEGALWGILESYRDETVQKVKRIVDTVTTEVMAVTKAKAPVKTGAYVKAFRTKTVFENRLNKKNRWYVASPHYRLTHLLEFGHANRGGTGRAKAIPHIGIAEELAQRRMVELLKEELSQ